MNSNGNSIFEKNKMTSSSREKRGFQAKQEGDLIDYCHVSRATSSKSRSSPWSAFRNPRVVRVSPAFGGKDRHSKVFTIRGLRDRRIRLSIPAAVQLYDLQEKLGLSQPSKVIDWLLNAAQCDINKLPPLQIPQDRCNQFNPSMSSKLWSSPFLQTNSTSMNKHGVSSKDSGIDINEDLFESERERMSVTKSNPSNMDDLVRARNKEIERGIAYEKGKWINSNVQESQYGIGSGLNAHVMSQNFLPMSNYNFSLSPSLTNNSKMPYSHCKPSNSSSSSSSSSSSQFGSYGFAQASEQYPLNTNSSSSPSLILPSRAHFCFCPPSLTSTPLIPSYSPIITTPLVENEMGLNHYQLFSSSSSSSQHVFPSFMPSLHLVSSPLLSSSINSRFGTPLTSRNSCQTDEHDDSS